MKKNTKTVSWVWSKPKLKWIKQKWIEKQTKNRKSNWKEQKTRMWEDMDVKRRKGKLKTHPDKILPVKKKKDGRKNINFWNWDLKNKNEEK